MLNVRDQAKCYFEETDSVNSFELCESNSKFVGGVYLICENKHVLRYFRNTDGSIDPDAVSNTISDLRKGYPLFFSETPNDVLEHYNYALYFMTTEYLSGAAYSIRTLLERLIYDNYGVHFFYKGSSSISSTNRTELESIYSRVGAIGFAKFVGIILSNSYRRDIKDGKEKKLKDDALSDAKIMIDAIEQDQENRIYLEEEDYKDFQIQYVELSKGLHPRTPMDSVGAERALKVVLKGYQNYFELANKWRVVYE